jgi:hypothetical protein
MLRNEILVIAAAKAFCILMAEGLFAEDGFTLCKVRKWD